MPFEPEYTDTESNRVSFMNNIIYTMLLTPIDAFDESSFQLAPPLFYKNLKNMNCF